MKHTKTNIIALLKAMENNKRFIARDTNDAKLKETWYNDAMTLDTVITLLTDKEFFNHMVEIYNIEKKEG